MIDILKKIKIFFVSQYSKIVYVLRDIIYPNSLSVDWYSGLNNFGDILNYKLLKILTNREVFEIRTHLYNKQNYMIIGSILQRANKYSIVWGSGFISEDSYCKEKPQKICAVRGPLTRKKLLKDGIACPEVYGDPALLLPLIYKPKIEKKYKIGIIPHYVDKSNIWLKNIQSDQIKILDIQIKDSFLFIDEILKCEKIASSSLHGIIVADAYSIPSIWVSFADNIMGGAFKYLDYFLSVKRVDREPLKINQNTKIEKLYEKFSEYKIELDLKKLIDAAPFEIDRSILKL